MLATKIPRRTSQILPQYIAAAILALFLLWSSDSRTSIPNQFINLTTYPSSGTPAKIGTADFNRDGQADVAALNTNHVLSILLGNGNGTFAAPKTISLNGSSTCTHFYHPLQLIWPSLTSDCRMSTIKSRLRVERLLW